MPAPEKPVTQIIQETLEEPVTRSTNRFWTEFTLTMIAGHFLGTKFGYWKLVMAGGAGLGLNIILNIIRENLSTANTNKSIED